MVSKDFSGIALDGWSETMVFAVKSLLFALHHCRVVQAFCFKWISRPKNMAHYLMMSASATFLLRTNKLALIAGHGDVDSSAAATYHTYLQRGICTRQQFNDLYDNVVYSGLDDV
jgi:hypothetical protein